MRLARRIAPLVGLALMTGGCLTPAKRQPAPAKSITAVVTKSDAWTAVASAADRNRIAQIAAAWRDGLAEARARGFGSDIKSEGKLLTFGGGLSRPAPTPGSYSCRVDTLGRSTKRGPAFEKFKPFFCYVDLEGELFTIVKQTGSQRPAGRLWEDDVPTRMIFLGSTALGNEDEAKAYGQDPRRDVAGVFERIAPFVWRLAIPYPQDGTKLQVFELTPVAIQPKP